MTFELYFTPQEASVENVENVGPVDDGTESLGDVPSLSEEITGIDKRRSVNIMVMKRSFSTIFLF